MKCRIALLSLLSCLDISAADLKIAEDGKPLATIVISKSAKPCVKKAAEELQLHIKKISGAELQLVKLDEAKQEAIDALKGKSLISLGDTPFARNAGLRPDALQDDGFAIRCDEKLLVIAGKDGARYGDNYRDFTDSAGTLYGVYSFLESLGVRWFYPNEIGTVIPKTATVIVKEQDRTESPSLHYRNIGSGAGSYAWRRRLKAGGTCNVWSTMHSVSIDLAKKFRDSRPELFLKDASGKRTGQVDLAHPDVQDEMARMAEARFNSKIDEGCKYFLILPLDGGGCEAAESEWILGVIEKLAWRMLKTHPQCKIVHCPYSNFVNSPERIRALPPNMVLLIALNRMKLLDEKPREEAYRMIARWQEFKPAAIYFCRYNDSLMKMNPAFFPHLISDDIKTLVKMSNKGYAPFDGEMNFIGLNLDSEFAWWEFPAEYFAAKLLWNPSADVEALIKDFCDKMFGPASAEMKSFILACEKAYADPAQREFFNVQTIGRLENLIASAKEKVKGQEEFEARVEFFSKGFEPMRALRAKMLSAEQTPKTAEPPEKALLAYFPFDEGTGPFASDAVSGKDGTLKNVEWVKGIKGKALRFAGGDSYVKLEPAISLANSDYSFEAWIKPEGMETGTQYILGPENWERQMLAVEYSYPTPDKGVAGRLVLKHRIWAPSYDGSNFELKSAVVEFKAGEWRHVAGTFSSKSGMTLYLDGKIVGIDVYKRTPSAMSLWYIGASGKVGGEITGCFQGAIDEVKIYDRELSYGEVRNAYSILAPK